MNILNKINTYLKQIGYIMILTHSLEPYSIEFPVFNITIFRLFFLMLVILFAFRILVTKKIIKTNIYIFLIFIGVSTVFSLFWNGVLKNHAYSITLNTFMGLLLIFIFINIYDNEKDILKLIKYYLFSFVFNIILYIHIIFSYYINGESIYNKSLPLINKIPLNLIYRELATTTSNGIPRVGLFYLNPTHLSIALSVAIVLGFYIYKKNTDKFKPLLILNLSVLFIMLLNTQSRSGIFAFFITLFFIFFLILIRKSKIFVKYLKYFTISFPVLIILILASVYYLDFSDILKLRIFSADILGSRHYLMRIEALKVWTSNINNFLFGVGLSNSSGFTDITTSHFHSPYFTVLAERGITGFILIFSFYFYLFISLLNKFLLKGKGIIFLASIFAILVGFLFYEFIYIIPTWILLSMISVYFVNRGKIND